MNLLAATACGVAAGISSDAIATALSQFAPVKGRGLQLALAGGGVVIDDTYNANPDSVRAAIDALITMPQPQMLVLGDMGEVGDQGDAFHDEVLHYAAQQNLRSLWLHGEAMAKASSRTKIGLYQESLPQLIAMLQTAIRQAQNEQRHPSVWVKGSRFMRMERVVEALIHPTGDPAPCC
jgi:UDP-N-acetylmuramoyl-tripeptide--D-alanyl-D-alanine ligase